MLAHGIARSAGIGKPDRFGAAAAARRPHNLLICPPSRAAYRLRGRCTPSPPATVRRLAPATVPPTYLGGAPFYLVVAPSSALRVTSRLNGGNSARGPTLLPSPPDPPPHTPCLKHCNTVAER